MYNFTYIQKPININIFKFSETINDNEFNLFKNDFDQLVDQGQYFFAIFDLLEIKTYNIRFFMKQLSYM